MTFIGRKWELERLKDLKKRNKANFVVISGRRRIGKSKLAEQFGKDYIFYSFTGLPPSKEKSSEAQRKYFSLQLEKYFNYPVKNDNWFYLLDFLAAQAINQDAVILLDEISWMAGDDIDFLGTLKSVWDQHFSKNTKLMLIICSSVASWVDKNILSSTGFMGRISLNLHLKELNLKECAEFWKIGSSKISSMEKFKILSVTGGVPRYLEELDINDTAENNIKKLCFLESGVLFNEFDQIFSDLFIKKNEQYKYIVQLLADGSKDRNTIATELANSTGGVLTEHLEELVKAGLIARDFTWQINSGKESQLSLYRLSDNYMRFYLKYIAPNTNKIRAGLFQKMTLSNLENWHSIVGLQFENLVLSNRRMISDELDIEPSSIISEGRFFQRSTNRLPGCQIDYMIQTKENILFVCEIKFTKNQVGVSVIDEMKEKIKRLKTPKNFSIIPVLIYCGELSEQVEDSGYFSRIVDFRKFLEG